MDTTTKNVKALALTGSDAQLIVLRDELNKELESRKAQKIENKKKELTSSGKLKELRDTKKELFSRLKSLVKNKKEITLSIPVKLTLNAELYSDVDFFDEFRYDPTIPIRHVGTLDKERASSFTPAQQKLLAQGISEFFGDVCEDVLKILPEGATEEYTQLEQDVKDFLKEVDKTGLGRDSVLDL